jgi:hypothetical protein
MLVGHVAVGLATKRFAPAISLGTLVLAALLADLVWSIFLLIGIEHVEFNHGKGAANYLVASDIGLSHSLAATGAWAALSGGLFFARRRHCLNAWILFAVAFSHWWLDWLSHRPDLPLIPGGRSHFGLGLWTSVPATLIIEGGFWLGAIALYLGTIRSKGWGTTCAFWIGVIVLTLAWWNNIVGSPPPNPQTAGISSLIFFTLTVTWAYWIDRANHGGVNTE